MTMRLSRHPFSIRPLVRYVDQDQAVIEVQVCLAPSPLPSDANPPRKHPLSLLIELHGCDGFIDEQTVPVHLNDRHGTVRFEVVHPQRWWPAGMGEQMLYDLSVTLMDDGERLDSHSTVLGLTSVRPADDRHRAPLLVNGQICNIDSIIAVDLTDESRMLPAAGNSLLLVRDHYGTDLLYDAADRAGILLVQCVPIHPRGAPEREFAAQIARLASHPSLAGWFVGHLGRMTDTVAGHIHQLDPTRAIFRHLPDRAA